MRAFTIAGSVLALAIAAPAAAQDAQEKSVFDGDYLSVGVGAVYGPTYDGSDDYMTYVVPLVQGRLKGVGISTRAGGIGLDFVPGTLNLGIAGRWRQNRSGDPKDAVVTTLGELDKAIEVGPTVGATFTGVLNPYDSLTVTTDVLWDIAGTHDGMVVDPAISYSTPLSRAMLASLSFSGEYGNNKFVDYYYRITPAQSLASGLPTFEPDGGVTKLSANLFLGFDLNGNLADGGLALFAIGGYTRMMGDAADAPTTSIRGSADQFLGTIGIGYTF